MNFDPELNKIFVRDDDDDDDKKISDFEEAIKNQNFVVEM